MTGFSRVTRDMADAPPVAINSSIPLVRPLAPEYEIALAEEATRLLRRLPTRDLEDELDYLRREQMDVHERTSVTRGVTEPDDWLSTMEYRKVAVRREIDRRARWGDSVTGNRPSLVTFAQDLKRQLELHVFVVHKGYCLGMRRMGHQYVACCPFHSERTGSFYIWSDPSPHFMCFGCGARGDVYDFIEQARMASSWREAVEIVADYLNVKLPSPRGTQALWEKYGS